MCGKRLKVMIPILLPALEQHGRLQLGLADRDRVLAISDATIDRLLVDVQVAASEGRRRRVGFYSAIRREVPIRTLNDCDSPPPASARSNGRPWRHVGGGIVHPNPDDGRYRDGLDGVPAAGDAGCPLVVEAMKHAQSRFPWLLRGVDSDNDSAFINDISTPYERALAHAAVMKRLCDQYRSLDPVALLAEIRATRTNSAIASIVVPDRRAACNAPHELRAGDRRHFHEDARQDGDCRRAACHTPASSSALWPNLSVLIASRDCPLLQFCVPQP